LNKKVIIGVIVFNIIFISLFILNKKDDIILNKTKQEYIGSWKAQHNASQAKVTIEDDEIYNIIYKNRFCMMVFEGSIYDIALEKYSLKILKLDIEREKSQCPYLTSPFMPSRFIFKIETLQSDYAKLKLFSVQDMENLLEKTQGNDTLKESLQSMIRVLKNRSGMADKMDEYYLEYSK